MMKMKCKLMLMFSAAMVWSASSAAHAEASELTKILHEAVAAMNPQQQTALLSFLTAFEPAVEADAAPSTESALEALRKDLEAYNASRESGTFTPESFLARLSDDFSNPMMGDKKLIVSWMKSMGLFSKDVPDLDFDLDEAELEVDGEMSIVDSIFVDSPFGRIELEVKGKTESDGIWRITDIALVGF